MSEFIKHLKAKITGRQSAGGFIPHLTVERISGSMDNFSMLRQHQIQTSYTVMANCTEEGFQAMMDNTLERIKSAVYGDLRGMLLDADIALIEGDPKKLGDVLLQIRKEIT